MKITHMKIIGKCNNINTDFVVHICMVNIPA